MTKKRMSKEAQAVYVISVAASLTGMHPQTLRIYERRGLIEPFRTPGGTRRYSEADLQRLALIAQLTGAGVNLEGAKRILQMDAENAALRAEVRRLRRQLAETEQSAAPPRGPRPREIMVRRNVLNPGDVFG